MENLKKLSRQQRYTALDIQDAVRWDHLWLYETFAQCRKLEQLQKLSRERTNG